jgi:hypothetical protein
VKLSFFSLSAGVILLAGCATTSQTQWTPTVDTYGNSRAQFLSRDMEECRALAMRASGTTSEQATRGAATSGLVGAAGGAALGGILGGSRSDVLRGAGVGAITGGIAGGTTASAQAEATFQRAFNNCMRGRGHNVLS